MRQEELARKIHTYEIEGLPPEEETALFSYLLESGLLWGLQGSYQKRAFDLFSQGLLSNYALEERASIAESEGGLDREEANALAFERARLESKRGAR